MNFCRIQLHNSIFRRLPFDWRNPSGFFMAFSVQCLVWFYVISGAVCNMILIGGCWMLTSLAIDLNKELETIKDIDNAPEQRSDLVITFNKIIQFHSKSKQFSF